MVKQNTGGLGFSLIELIFAMAIVTVLTAIGIPTYRGYIDKKNINNAILKINAIQVCIERFYTTDFKYPDTIDDIATCLPDKGLDPWGKPYQYLNIIDGGPGIKGKVRKDHKLNPINTNYDLYSMGKDGVSKTQVSNKDSLDDIIIARDGGFIGLAADF